MSVFASPLGLLALLALPAIVFIHLYHRRHRELAVSALFLWDDPESLDTAGRTRQPLRRSASLWLELAAALLAALLLSGFDPLGTGEAVHLVAVLDDSASMGARTADGVSAAERAAQSLLERLTSEGRRTRVTLVRSGRRPTLLCGPAALLGEGRDALAAWRPTAPSHDLRPALALARELAGDGEVVLCTDRLPGAGDSVGGSARGRAGGSVGGTTGDTAGGSVELSVDDATRVLAFGAPLDNLALTDARRTPLPDGVHDRVECAVRSFAAVERSGRVAINAGDASLGERSFTLAPGGSARLTFELPATAPALRLALRLARDGDALALDDQAVLHPPPRRVLRVGVALDEGLGEELGLPGLPRVFAQTELVTSAPDLVIAHEPAPAPAWSLVLPHDDGELEAFVGPFVLDKRHPLLEGVTLEGMVWTRALAFEADGLPLVSAGERTLLSETVSGRARRYRLDLVPLRSSVQRSPDWPILLANLLAARRATLPGPREVNLVAGQALECVSDEAQDWTLAGPWSEPRAFLDSEGLVLDDLPSFGDYRLSADGRPVTGFAVNFADAAESDLSARGRGEASPRAADTLLARGGQGDSPLTLVLLLLLLAALLGDWWVLGGGPGGAPARGAAP